MYMFHERPSCRRLLRQIVPVALSLARVNAGSSMAARIAMMAMTTRSSIRVKPLLRSRDFIMQFVMRWKNHTAGKSCRDGYSLIRRLTRRFLDGKAKMAAVGMGASAKDHHIM